VTDTPSKTPRALLAGLIVLSAGALGFIADRLLLGAVAAVTATARDMLRLFAEYVHLTFTFFHVVLEEEPARGRVIFVDDGDLGDLHRFYLDREIAFIHWAVHKFEGIKDLLEAIDLDYPEPLEAARYHALCPCPVRFGAAQAAVSFDFRHDQPRADTNPLGTAILSEHLRSFGSAGAGHDPVDRVRREITLAVARRQTLPELDVVAAALGLSERALRRRLSAAGTSFRALADGVLAAFATRFLRDTSLSVAAVAERLGYSEPASFVRAFRRWTGTTPEAFREVQDPAAT